MEVKKRDNTTEVFQGDKITNAIIRAFDACHKQINFNVLDCIQEWVDSHPEEATIDVEDIQNKIEDCLMDCDKEVARAYIKYRYEHKLIRETRDQIIKGLSQKLTASNVQNQNANVDEYSFGGRLGEATSLVTKDYALRYCIGRRFKNAHENNEVYIHDLDSYAVGSHNCLSEPMDLLFKNGFKTRQVDIRPPKSVNTAMQLVAVAFQVQSLQQFGGVAATHLDWSMVPMVRYSFTKHLGDGLIYIEGKSGYKAERFHKWLEKNSELGVITFEDEEFKKLHPQVWEYAMDMTEREVKQAVEGLYHNLNSLQSRSGNQLPFSSVNYGTCTLPEGRLIIKAMLEGSIEGVGKFHRTSIFPCGIFTWKKEVNAYKGTPNYDLYRLALRSSAQRIYPNYANGDLTSHIENIKLDRKQKKKFLQTLSEKQIQKLTGKVKYNKELQERLLLNVDKNGKLYVNEEEQPVEIMSTMGKW